MRVISHRLHLSGSCDVVEFHADPSGISLQKWDGLWKPIPVEYKHGHSKENDADRLQLCAQAMALEEMLVCEDVYKRQGYESIPQLLKKLENYIQPWWNPKTELNHKRCEILRNCLDSGHTNEKGLYTLTVPTGGGKTVSSLAFALSMACEKKMDRVIYVIPYTSIIDQTAKEFSKILGKENIIEHHSGIDYTIDENSSEDERKKALAIENWDAPVIVTTAVQFFESLYANRTSRCRKLHRCV